MSSLILTGSLCKGKSAIERIAKIQQDIRNSDDSEIKLAITSEGRLGLTFAFLIGSLPLYANKYGKKLTVFVSEKIYRVLHSINVLDYYKRKSNNAEYQVKFEDTQGRPAFKEINSSSEIISFVNEIKMEVPLRIKDVETKNLLTSRIAEIYLNALEHAGASLVLGGKYFKFQKYKYCFSCYDNGIGIPTNVNKYFGSIGRDNISDADAIKWSLQKGNSTSPDRREIPRGVGLDLLRSFAVKNAGVIRICSGRCMYIMHGDGKAIKEKYLPLEYAFDGTLFEMDIISNSVKLDEGSNND